MKALMSVGALIGVAGILLLLGMILGVVPSNTVRLDRRLHAHASDRRTCDVRGGIYRAQLHDGVNGNGLPAFLAGHFFLGVYSPIFEIS